MTVSFAALLFILRRYAWKPILKSLHNRENTIDEALNMANATREEMKNWVEDTDSERTRRTRDVSSQLEISP